MPIPVYLVTGFPGAGKTTVIDHWLGSPEVQAKRTAVIVNDFGSLGVDAYRIRRGDYDLYEVNGGSLFCVCVRTSFVKTLERIAEDVNPDLLIVEATGVTEIFDLQETLAFPGIEGKFEVKANVCVVDGVHFTRIMSRLPFAPLQVRWADGVVLNKCDKLENEAQQRLLDLLFDLNPKGKQTSATRGQVLWSFVEELGRRVPPQGVSAGPPADIVACALTKPKADHEAFQRAVNSLGERILRMKGFLDFGQGLVYVESVGGAYQEIKEWSGDTIPPTPEPGVNVIGWKIGEDELRDAFSAALLD